MFDFEKIKNSGNNFAPLQIVHDFQFTAINVKDDYSCLKSMSDGEKLAYMEQRVENLANDGYGGIVVNVDFENYLKNDASFIILDKVVDKASQLGLRVWLYDEQYYPSGCAGGLVLKDHPELEGQGLVCVTKEITGSDAAVRIASPHGHSELKYAFAVPKKNGTYDFGNKINISNCKDLAGGLCWNCDEGDWKVYCFFIRVLYEMTTLPISFRASRRFPNIADKKAMKRFLEVTFEKYERFLKTPLGKRIEAVFTDEPSIMFYREYPEGKNPDEPTKYASISVYDRPDLDIPPYPYIPWANDIEEEFHARFGYKLSENLPELFDETDNSQKTRCDFYTNISAMVESAYVESLSDYIHSQQMMLTGHYLWEESFDRHPFMYGDILRHLGKMDVPGCDVLFSAPEKLRYSTACKLASSAAHIYKRDHVMIEASNMLDQNQDFSLKDMTAAITMMYVNGIDTITSYFGENIFTDDERKRFTRYTSFLGNLLQGGSCRIDTLLYYPFEQLSSFRTPEGPGFPLEHLDAFCINDVSKGMLGRQISFDFINREKLLLCGHKNGKIVTDYNENVRRIVFPKIDFITEDVARFVNKAHENGVEIVFWGDKRQIKGLSFEPVFTDDASMLKQYDLKIDATYKYITYIHKTFEAYDLYLLMNSDNKVVETEISVPCVGEQIMIVDLEEEELRKTDFVIEDKYSKLHLTLPALTGIAFVVLKDI